MARLLIIFLTSAIVMGLSPTSHSMLSMQTMHMDEMTISNQSNMDQGSGKENSTGSCCDEMASISIGCFFLIPQCVCIDLSGGATRVLSSNSMAQSIYIVTVTPPPKV
jgi:hypothetical protein